MSENNGGSTGTHIFMKGEECFRIVSEDEYIHLFCYPNMGTNAKFPDGFSKGDYKFIDEEQKIIVQSESYNPRKNYKKAFLISTNNSKKRNTDISVSDPEKPWEIFLTNEFDSSVTDAWQVSLDYKLNFPDMKDDRKNQVLPKYVIKVIILEDGVKAVERQIEKSSKGKNAPEEYIIRTKEKRSLAVAFCEDDIIELSDHSVLDADEY